MSFKLATRTTFSPLGQYYQHPAKGVPNHHALGMRRKCLNQTCCKLKHSKKSNDQGILNARNIRIGLEGLVGLAATMLNNGIIENSSEPQTTAEHVDKKPYVLEPISEFGLHSRALDTVIRALVKRPRPDKELEILVVDGIEYVEDETDMEFDMYINKALAHMAEPDYGELLGSELDVHNGSLEVDITNWIEVIDAEDSEHLVVTLVPRAGKAIIGGVRIMAKEVSGNIQISNLFTYRNDEKRKLIMINLKNEFQISKNVAGDVRLVIWLMSYVTLFFLFKDFWAELTNIGL